MYVEYYWCSWPGGFERRYQRAVGHVTRALRPHRIAGSAVADDSCGQDQGNYTGPRKPGADPGSSCIRTAGQHRYARATLAKRFPALQRMVLDVEMDLLKGFTLEDLTKRLQAGTHYLQADCQQLLHLNRHIFPLAVFVEAPNRDALPCNEQLRDQGNRRTPLA